MTRRAVCAAVAVGVSAFALSPGEAGAQTGCGLSSPGDRVVVAGGATVGPADTAGDLFVVDGDVEIAGRVAGDATVLNGDVTVSGCVGGDLTTVAGRATLLPGARIGGDLVYSDERPVVAQRATIGGEVREDTWDDFLGGTSWAIVGAAALWVSVTLSLLVLGIVLVALLPRAAEAAHDAARSQFWLCFALGLAAVLCLLLAAGLSAVTLVGLPLSITIGLALIPLWALSYLSCCQVLGRAVVKRPAHPLLAFLAGFGILRAVALIPVVGALAWIPAGLIGLGALVVAAMPGAGESRAVGSR